MRPPEFTGGNPSATRPSGYGIPGFNEAAGIHRRKRPHPPRLEGAGEGASMRPPEFTGGNKEELELTNRLAVLLQ